MTWYSRRFYQKNLIFDFIEKQINTKDDGKAKRACKLKIWKWRSLDYTLITKHSQDRVDRNKNFNQLS